MGGFETWQDALEFILLGAGTVQVTTAVMQYGYRIIDDLKAGLNLYLTEKRFKNVTEASVSVVIFAYWYAPAWRSCPGKNASPDDEFYIEK